MKKIPVVRSSMPKFADYVEEIKDIWDTHWLTNMGIKHKQLEESLKKYLNVDNCVLYTNGHLALESIIDVLNLEGEVITTPFTFVSTTNAIVRKGLKPVFCDINPDNYTMDVSKIEELITERTCAILPVHVYGNIADVEAIDLIAKKYNLKVIYDAAHAFGIEYKNKNVASFGDASMFSFHATKVFNTIEGGAVTFTNNHNNKSLYEKLSRDKNFGIAGPEMVNSIGGNAKMNEFQAAMGLCNLKEVDSHILMRKNAFKYYKKNLDQVSGIKLIEPSEHVNSNYAYFPVVFDGFKKDRDTVYSELLDGEVFSRKYFYPLVSDFDCYKEHYDSDETPVAKDIASKVLTLPLFAGITEEEIDRVCSIILKGE